MELTLESDPVILKAAMARPSVEPEGLSLTLPLTLIRVVLGIYRTADQQFSEQHSQRGNQHRDRQYIRNQAGDDQQNPCHEPRDVTH